MKDDVIEGLQAIFREEAAELLDRLAEAFTQLPQAASSERVKDIATICMRHAHSLKGAAASVGFEEVAVRAHAMEDEIAKVARREAEPTPAFIADLLATADGLRAWIADPARFPAAAAGPPAAKSVQPPKITKPREEKRGEEESAPAASRTTVRVSAERLDRVMAHAEELLTIQSRERDLLASQRLLYDRLGETGAQAGRRGADSGLRREFEEQLRGAEDQSAGLDRLVSELAEALKELRMVPVSSVVPLWQRAVRDASRVLGKPVRLDVLLGDLELDKAVLDLLTDPVIHLLRNSVDHGIEKAEDRARTGKAPMGRIEISGELRGPSVLLNISDDGRGLDIEGLKSAARARGIIAEGVPAVGGDRELIDLIFFHGFSTRSEVSAISGRGVGLDVVRDVMDKLGGKVGVVPFGRLGGASFELEVPLSILSTRGLLVESGATVAAIPIEAVERTLEADAGDLADLDGSLVLKQDGGEPLPIVILNDLIGSGRPTPAKRFQVVLLAGGQRRFGLAVDRVRGESEFVTRRLPWNLRRVRGVNGAIVQPDGTLALVVDVADVLAETGGQKARDRRPDEQPAAGAGRRARILVVDDSLTARTLHRNTLQAAGYEVETAVDGVEALRILESGAFSLLVSDVEMPFIDGIELTRRVRASGKLRGLPVILVSQRSRSTDIESGLAAGADEYIVKGVLEQQKLLEAVAARL